MTILRKLFLLVALAPLLNACDRSGTDPDEGNLFRRYVALGNSITAGFESEGINDSTQMNAYSVLLAAKAGAQFNVARLQKPGCPAPLIGPAPLTAERVGGGTTPGCAGLATPLATPVQSLAFPGFRIADALQLPGGVTGLLYAQVFGTRTLVQAMREARPSLVSVWLGNNDALSAALSGDLDQLTSLASFQTSVNAISAAIAETSARDAILIGVTDPQRAPVLQPGAYYWAVKQDPVAAALLPRNVNDNCAPLLPTGQLNPLAANLVSLLVVRDNAVAEISCADDAPYLLNASEQQAIREHVAEFNQLLQAAAHAHGWIYLDADELTRRQLTDPNRVRKCQALAGATAPQQFVAAVLASCPHPTAPNFFGSLISFDGVHPSRAGQQLIADELAAALRAKHGLSL
ncbi:MAG TPA: SGNH/GDSL hydrolase family protein [Longimicrobiaceae bacterium]|nr:SGNH/GDSL hydrolase family protein [Longimicrobiaceae bacterium]